ncbi:MAG TPA: methyltransferase domain-containing protein [Rugosimonospora sp.]|nr:methyltransferase domain-containing protein [Rugosimonospora sp.]
MTLWLHEISEAHHRILNPFTDEKLMLLGTVSRVGPGTRILDLACGKGELLCRWAQVYGSGGHGVDISEVFVPAARARAAELGVADRVSVEVGDAAAHVPDTRYDIVSCIGATWIGNGLLGTLALMRRAVRPGGLLLVGEPYWTEPPPQRAYPALSMTPDEFASLPGTLDRFESAGVDLVEMVLADGDSWDRYVAEQWWTLAEWLRAHPDDERAQRVRAFRDAARRSHLEYQRRYLGWGVFVLRVEA